DSGRRAGGDHGGDAGGNDAALRVGLSGVFHVPRVRRHVPDLTRLAFFGGIYSNARALSAAIAEARRRGADAMYALGDFGAFGPHPDRIFPILREAGVLAIQGNYEESLSEGPEGCRCGYTGAGA